VLVSFNKDKGAFMKVNNQATGCREGIQHRLEVDEVFRNGPDNDEGVVGVLERETEHVANQG
jgi:hypothetical protein